MIHNNTLTDITNSLNICLAKATNQVPTKYADNPNNSNLDINLIFLCLNSEEFNNYTIYTKWRISLDHTPLMVNILIFKKHIQTRK